MDALRRILTPYNLLPLFLVPVVFWGFDLIVHLFLERIQEPKVWITLLTLAFPLIAYVLILKLHKLYASKVSTTLSPEIPGLVGLLYAQPTYMILLKLAIDGGRSIPLDEALRTIGVLTLTVPLSSFVISTYDGTLLALPFACLTMLVAARRFRRKHQLQLVGGNSDHL